MAARRKRFQVFAITSAYAGIAMMPIGASAADVCDALARHNVTNTTKALKQFLQPVFGKHPERWLPEDVESLLQNAKECDNKPAHYRHDHRVYFGNWNRALNANFNRELLQIANASTRLATHHQKDWPKDVTLAYCGDLLKWRRDPVWLHHTGEEIFGKPFTEVSEEDAAKIKEYVTGCGPIADEIAKRRGSPAGTGKKIIADIVKTIDRDQASSRWAHIELAPSLQVQHDGKTIPFSHLTPSTQEVVLQLNFAEQNQVSLNVDELAAISAWAAGVLQRDEDGPDRAYVAVIKEIVNRQMFSQERIHD